MKLLIATLAFCGSHMLPRTDEEAAWRALKKGCGYLAAYWMTLGAHCGLQADAARETERLKAGYRRDALAELGEFEMRPPKDETTGVANPSAAPSFSEAQ